METTSMLSCRYAECAGTPIVWRSEHISPADTEMISKTDSIIFKVKLTFQNGSILILTEFTSRQRSGTSNFNILNLQPPYRSGKTLIEFTSRQRSGATNFILYSLLSSPAVLGLVQRICACLILLFRES